MNLIGRYAKTQAISLLIRGILEYLYDIKVRYFSSLKELRGMSEERLEITGTENLDFALNYLKSKEVGDRWGTTRALRIKNFFYNQWVFRTDEYA